jgi:hypothetical protein
MFVHSPKLRWVRATIFVFLALLVTSLGAAAKHSQFESLAHRGYLAKAVKMDGIRTGHDFTAEAVLFFPVSNLSTLPTAFEMAMPRPASAPDFAVSLLSPPLRR